MIARAFGIVLLAALCASCTGFPDPDENGPAPFYRASTAPIMSAAEAETRLSTGLPGWRMAKTAGTSGGKSTVVGIVVAAKARSDGVRVQMQDNNVVTLTDTNVHITYTKNLSPVIRVGDYAFTTTQALDARDVRLLADSINKFTHAAQIQ